MTRSLMQMLVELPMALDVLLKASLILGLGWALHCALVRSNPRWRVLLWRAVSMGMLLAPLLALVMPTLKLTVPPSAARDVIVVNSDNNGLLIARDAAQARTLSHAPVSARSQQKTRQSFLATVREHLWLSVFIGWAGVCALLACNLFISLRGVRRLLLSSSPADGRIQEILDDLRGNLGITRALELRVSGKLSSPFLYGFRRPVIILPERMTQGDYVKELPAIFVHELAHLKGHDLAWMSLIHSLEIVFWFHPLAWRMREAHAAACETVCDAVAATYVGSSLVYSRTLARIALELVALPPTVGGIAMARMPEVRRRLELLKKKIHANPLARRWVAASILTGLTVLVIVAGIKVIAADPASGQSQTAPSANHFAVKFVDEKGRGIAGVKAEIVSYYSRREGGNNTESVIQTSGADGKIIARIPERWPDRFRIKASAPQYPTWYRDWQSDQLRKLVPREYVFPMIKTTRIGGVVRSETGAPIPGVKIHIEAHIGGIKTPDHPFVGVIHNEKSDSQGRWECNHLPENFDEYMFILQVRHPDFAEGPLPSERPTIEDLRKGNANLVLHRGQPLSGKVTDPTGKPVKNALVMWKLGVMLVPSFASVLTDAEGRFHFEHICPPPFADAVLGVWAPGWAPDVRKLKLLPDQKFEPVQIQLRMGQSLRVRVVDRSGKPVAGASVMPFLWRTQPFNHCFFNFLYLGSGSSFVDGMDEDRLPTAFEYGLAKVTDQEGRWAWNWAPEEEVEFTISNNGSTTHSVLKGNPNEQRIVLSADGSDGKTRVSDHSSDRQIRLAVRLPDGKPAAEAKVFINISPQRGITLRNGQVVGRDSCVSLKTDAGGRIAFDVEQQESIILVLHDFGYAAAMVKKDKPAREITLEPWGRVEGKMLVGRVPQKNQEVILRPRSYEEDEAKSKIAIIGSVQTDESGRFAFDRVAPGVVYVMLSGAHEFLSVIEVKPGQTTQLRIGGAGRPVIGRIAVSKNPPVIKDWTNEVQAYVLLERAKPQIPSNLTTVEKMKAWGSGWRKTEEGKAHELSSRSYQLNVKPDWTFRAEDIPPGKYFLNIRFNKLIPDKDNPRNRTAQRIAEVKHNFEMAEMSGGQSNEPLDLGSLPLEMVKKWESNMAPAFECTTVDGKMLRLADFRGKYVVLDFWVTWCEPCVEELPNLQALWKNYGRDDRLAVISLSLDDEPSKPKEFAEKADLGWIQGFLGKEKGKSVTEGYGVSGVPHFFLIDPKGRIIANGHSGKEIKEEVEKLLGKSSP